MTTINRFLDPTLSQTERDIIYHQNQIGYIEEFLSSPFDIDSDEQSAALHDLSFHRAKLSLLLH